MLKRWSATLVLIAALSSIAWAGVEILNFSVYPLGDHARLEWRTGQEINFDKFVVERSSDGQYFMPVGQIDARGAFTEYAFTDESPLDDGRERLFFYRLKMLNDDGTFGYTQLVEVSLSFSPVQQTWGSIKAMFR